MNPHFGGRIGETISTDWQISSHTSFHWDFDFSCNVWCRQYRLRVPNKPFRDTATVFLGIDLIHPSYSSRYSDLESSPI